MDRFSRGKVGMHDVLGLYIGRHGLCPTKLTKKCTLIFLSVLFNHAVTVLSSFVIFLL